MGSGLDIAYVGDRFVDELAAEFGPDGPELTVYSPTPGDAPLADRLADGDRFDCVVLERASPGASGDGLVREVAAGAGGGTLILLADGDEGPGPVAVSAAVAGSHRPSAAGGWGEVATWIAEQARTGETGAGGRVGPAAGRYGHLVEQNIAGVYEVRGQELTYVNPTFADIFGYTQAELVGTDPAALLCEADRRDLERNMAALQRGDVDSVDAEHRGRRKDGSEVVVAAHGRLVEADPEPVYLGFVRDVTDEKRRQRRLRALFDNTYQLTGILSPDGTLIEANGTAREFVGVSPGEAAGEPVWETPWFGDADARATVREGVEVARQGEQFRAELTLRGTDTDRVVDFSLRPVRDDAGEVTLLIAEGHDVTERTARERERARIISRVTDAIVEVDSAWRFTMVDERAEELYGIPEADLLGRDFWEVFPDALDTRFEEVYRRVMQTREPDSLEEYYGDILDAWFHVDVYPSADGGVAFYFRDISDRKRREEQRVGLNEMLGELMETDSPQRVAEILVETSADQLHVPVAAVALVDGGTGDLEMAARSAAAREHLADAVLREDGGPVWEAYTTGEARTIDPENSPAISGSPPADALTVYPLGKHGVVVLGGPDPDREFLETVCGDLRTALDRIERRSLLDSRETELAEKTDLLDRVTRINDVIRRIDQALVEADTRAEIERAVCRELTEVASYSMAWIGEFDRAEGRVRPRESRGDGTGYLEGTDFSTAGDLADRAPPARAAVTTEPVLMADAVTDPPYAAWREGALKRGFNSSISLPLVYRDTLYGVLSVYADRPGMFDDLEQQVLADLSDTIAYSLNSVQSKKALVSDEVVELDLLLEETAGDLLAFLAASPDREFELKGIVPGEDDRYRLVYRLGGATRSEVRAFTDRAIGVATADLIAEREAGYLLESRLTEENLFYWLLDRGAVPRSFSLTDGGGLLRVELPREATVRDFVEQFQSRYPDSELVASRQRERDVSTREEFETAFEEALTARQRETLHTAFLSGYFDTPRERNGQEIAESMGIAQPTFSDNLRAGLRNLLGLLYAGDDDRG